MGERGALKGGCNLTALGIRVGKLDRRGFVRGGRQTDRQTDSGRARGGDGTVEGPRHWAAGTGNTTLGCLSRGPRSSSTVSWGGWPVPQSS